jgi:hypothetical protein
MAMANAAVRGSLISVGLAGAICALAAQAAEAPYVVPGSKAASLERCVEPTEFMRRNHMELIKHQRVETVHEGIRSTRHSLAGCIECHASVGADGAPVPVNAEKQFCDACHDFAAVSLDCFDCHATVPTAAEKGAGIPGEGGRFAWHPSAAGAFAGHPGPSPDVGGEGK